MAVTIKQIFFFLLGRVAPSSRPSNNDSYEDVFILRKLNIYLKQVAKQVEELFSSNEISTESWSTAHMIRQHLFWSEFENVWPLLESSTHLRPYVYKKKHGILVL